MIELTNRFAINCNLPFSQNGFEDIATFMGEKAQQTGKQGVVFFHSEGIALHFFLALTGVIFAILHICLIKDKIGCNVDLLSLTYLFSHLKSLTFQ